MSYPINYPTPQGANVQIFQLGGSVSDWVKPQGASFVWFTLIGAGGKTDGTATFLRGGGSGAVTNFMGPAFLIPDVLQVQVGNSKGSGNDLKSIIRYQQKDGSGYTLLNANGGATGDNGGSGGTATPPEAFGAMGFSRSTGGQDGLEASVTASATTFLSGGSYSGSVTANYGYSTNRSGFFQMQPIIVGVGGSTLTLNRGGIGCGGGGSVTTSGRGLGGDGLVVIITW